MTGSPDCQMPLPPTRIQHELALRVVGTEHDGRILRIQSPKCTIGSAAGCTLRLRAPGVQDVHCLVLRGPGGLAVRSWSADTRLNGQSFLDSPLSPGDRLVVGPVELEVLDTSTPALPTTTAPLAVPAFDITRLEQTRQEAEAAIAARDALARRIAERDEHVARLSTQLSAAERLVEQLKREATVSSPAIDPSAGKVAALEQQIHCLNEQISATQTAREADQRASAEEVAALQQAVEQALTQLEQHKVQAAHDHARLAADLERATLAGIANVDQQREHREREVALTHWRERAEEQKLRIAELEEQLAGLESQGPAPADDHTALRAELEAAARELDAETERLLQREQALETKLQEWEAEQLQVAAEITAERARLKEQAAELAECASRAPAATALEEQQEALATQAKELALARQALAVQQEALAVAQRDLATQQQDHDQLLAGHEELRASQIAADTAAADALAEERDALMRLSAELEAQRALLARQAEDLAEARRLLVAQQEEVAAQQKELAEHQQHLTTQRETLAEQQAALEAQQAVLVADREQLAYLRTSIAETNAAPPIDDEDVHESEAAAEEETTPYQPQSASDIIAKLSASGLWKEDVPEVEEPPAPAAPEPAWKSLVPPQEAKPQPVSAASDDEDSIEAYMQRLLQRVSGDSDSTARRPIANHAAVTAPVAPIEPVAAPKVVEKVPDEEPFDFNSYVPRTAPELTANLAAMRELANTSARTAIDSSSKRQQAKHATSKIVLSLGAIGTAIALGWLSFRTHSLLSYYAALSAGAASLLWGLHAGYLWIKARYRKSTNIDIADPEE